MQYPTWVVLFRKIIYAIFQFLFDRRLGTQEQISLISESGHDGGRGNCEPILPSPTTHHPLQDFRYEAARLTSFHMWQMGSTLPAKLAGAGFFSIDSVGVACCAFCHIIIGDWVESSLPWNDHARLSTECPFINGAQVGNVSLKQEGDNGENDGAFSGDLSFDDYNGPRSSELSAEWRVRTMTPTKKVSNGCTRKRTHDRSYTIAEDKEVGRI